MTLLLPSARVDTQYDGRLPIARVLSGTMVLSQRGEYREVQQTRKERSVSDFFTITTGKTSHGPSLGQVTASAGSEFLTPKCWVPAAGLRVGDWVAVKSKNIDGELVPWFRQTSNSTLYRGEPVPARFMKHDVELRERISKDYPTGRLLFLDAVRPDAIIIDWARKSVTAVEYERNRACPNNPRKYDLVPGMYDHVEWILTGKKGGSPRREYRVLDGNVFVRIRRIDKKRYRTPMTGFGLSVADDAGYMVGLHLMRGF
jgi:hypothetical protein